MQNFATGDENSRNRYPDLKIYVSIFFFFFFFFLFFFFFFFLVVWGPDVQPHISHLINARFCAHVVNTYLDTPNVFVLEVC